MRWRASAGRAMFFVYFSLPVIAGYNIMNYTNKIAEENYRVHEKRLRALERANRGAQRQRAELNQMLDEELKRHGRKAAALGEELMREQGGS